MHAIVIFAKPPVPGKTKSRLAADTSPEFAAELSKAMLHDLVHQALPISADLFLYYPPDADPDAFGDLRQTVPKMAAQVGNDLGERMYTCFRSLLKGHYDRVIIIGSDCISHSTELLESAFRELEHHDLVIQPADDGGYVLIGMNKPVRSLFDGIDWGTDSVMDETRTKLREEGLSYVELPASFDVDTVDDLKTLRMFLETNSRRRVSAVLG